MKKEYYYIEVHIKNKKLVGWGTTAKATLTGETKVKNVHRAFLTKGQFNKLSKKL